MQFHWLIPLDQKKKVSNHISIVLVKLKYTMTANGLLYALILLKTVNFLLCQHSGYAKFPCFFYLWDSRVKSDKWIKRLARMERLDIWDKKCHKRTICHKRKSSLPPLHITLGLNERYLKASHKYGNCFSYISRKFPRF